MRQKSTENAVERNQPEGTKVMSKGWCSAWFLLTGGFIFYYYLTMPHDFVLILPHVPSGSSAGYTLCQICFLSS